MSYVSFTSSTGADASPSSRRTHRTLIVDDNIDSAESLGMVLETLGGEVRVVGSGQAALREIEEFQPSVVLLDIGMLGMDGYEVARRVRGAAHGRKRVLIAVTCRNKREDEARSRAAGIDHHLTKPVDLRALEHLLETLKAE